MKLYIPILLVFFMSVGCSKELQQPTKHTQPVIQENDIRPGGCINKSVYLDVIPIMKQQGIKHWDYQSEGTDFICYNKDDIEVVHQIMDSVYGKDPGPNNIGLGDKKEMDRLENELKSQAIPYSRNIYLGTDVIAWEGKDDFKVRSILKNDFNTDLDRMQSNMSLQR